MTQLNTRIFVVLVTTLCFLWGAVKYAAADTPRVNPTPYAGELNEAVIAQMIAWYMEHSLSSLSPNTTIPISPRQFRNSAGEKISVEEIRNKLQELGVWQQRGKNSLRLVIQQPYRNYIWWRGKESAADEFEISPFEYQLVSIDHISEARRGNVPVARIEFTWRVKQIVPIINILREAGWEPENGLSWNEQWEQLTARVGSISRSTIELDKGIYGYFLPIIREPML